MREGDRLLASTQMGRLENFTSTCSRSPDLIRLTCNGMPRPMMPSSPESLRFHLEISKYRHVELNHRLVAIIKSCRLIDFFSSHIITFRHRRPYFHSVHLYRPPKPLYSPSRNSN